MCSSRSSEPGERLPRGARRPRSPLQLRVNAETVDQDGTRVRGVVEREERADEEDEEDPRECGRGRGREGPPEQTRAVEEGGEKDRERGKQGANERAQVLVLGDGGRYRRRLGGHVPGGVARRQPKRKRPECRRRRRQMPTRRGRVGARVTGGRPGGARERRREGRSGNGTRPDGKRPSRESREAQTSEEVLSVGRSPGARRRRRRRARQSRKILTPAKTCCRGPGWYEFPSGSGSLKAM